MKAFGKWRKKGSGEGNARKKIAVKEMGRPHQLRRRRHAQSPSTAGKACPSGKGRIARPDGTQLDFLARICDVGESLDILESSERSPLKTRNYKRELGRQEIKMSLATLGQKEAGTQEKGCQEKKGAWMHDKPGLS